MAVWDILGATAYRKIGKKKDKNRGWPTKIIGKIEQKKCATFAGNAYHNNYDHEKLTYSKSQNNI